MYLNQFSLNNGKASSREPAPGFGQGSAPHTLEPTSSRVWIMLKCMKPAKDRSEWREIPRIARSIDH